MKKALIFSLSYYPLVGGAEVAVKEITDRIDPEDITFHLIAYRFDKSLPDIERIGNVIVHRVGRGGAYTNSKGNVGLVTYLGKIAYVPLAALTAWRLNRTHRFAFFWSIMSYMVLPVVLLRVAGVRIPYILTLQDGDPYEHVFERPHIKLVAPLLSYGFQKATAVQAISTFLLSWARRLGYRGAGYVVPNGVDVALFSQKFSEKELDQERERIGAQMDDVLLVTTSRLVHKNGLDDVIRALPLLPSNIRFVIYGEGPDEESLRALANELDVRERVLFMGHIYHDDMPRALKACDVFIRPSRSEGMGNSFIEAMAAEIPVIATQEGGIADFLFDAAKNPEKQATGWAVLPNDNEDIARVVTRVLSNKEERGTTIRSARDLVSGGYDWENVTGRMRNIFNSL